MEVLQQFSSLVRSKAKKYPGDPLQNSEDIEQELWMKLMQVIPTLETIPPEELFAFASTVLNNHIRDLIRKSKTRAHLNHKLRLGNVTSINEGSVDSLSDFDFEDMVIHELEELHGAMIERTSPVPYTPEDYVLRKQLEDEILGWANTQEPKTRRFLNEFVRPSDETLDVWDQMVDSNPHYKTYDHIPPGSFAKIHGLSRVKIVRVMKRLRNHLIDQGFVQPKVA